MAARPREQDLFALFPDLPRMRHRTREDVMAMVRRQVNATRERARRNIERQRAATARVRAAISARRRRR
jgi:hypothetical protein